jgi:subtilisin family serine protease
VISISWGLLKKSENIAKALREAYSNDVVIFAAAGNDGKRQPIAFPADFRSCVICIGAADGDGITLPITARETDQGQDLEKFTAPGKAVKCASIRTPLWDLGTHWQSFMSQGYLSDTEHVTGTSMATPIAAGIAALFIQYTRYPHNKCKNAKSHENMLKLFSAMCKDKGETFRFLAPWNLLTNDDIQSFVINVRTALLAGNITSILL